MGAAALPSLDPFQDISPLLGSHGDDNDTRGISDKVNVPVEVKGFINPIVDDDDDEDNDEFYVCQEGELLSSVETLLMLLLMMMNRLINL